ncbi:two-component sensor histidine kinase [Streptomyces sulfonofaciens]|uniref:histidine kinase n=1 Tax=Streptomyces sulfonofaciens TaxID=68272 RepID=A0A919L2D8_9ACTN|nr:histidine kinase [Streptomyces sulfonofaciens]GHH80874.1 two-component sensor histidine kinase [Streptomyces sulfonofaciens]
MALSAPARPHRADHLIAGAGLLSGVLLWALGLTTQSGRLLGAAWVPLPLVVTAALELLRRTRPHTALLVATAAVTADQFTPGNLATVLMFTDIMYAAVVYGTPAQARRIPIVAGLVTVSLTLGVLAWWRTPQALLIGVLCGLVAFTPAATGALVRNHRDAAETERLRAEQTALLAEADRVQAVTAERARMARELHDMVAGHLSAIAIHSTAALSLDEPRTSREALAVIRENSVEGLADMRRLIGILRDPGNDREPAPAPTLDAVDALVSAACANGLAVRLDDTRPPGRALPAPVELAAYRIVQESLTNALKHASPGRVTVALTVSQGALEVRVTSPHGPAGAPRAPGAGAGLVGMRERTALLGGAFHAGGAATADGAVWTVSATLPLDTARTAAAGAFEGAWPSAGRGAAARPAGGGAHAARAPGGAARAAAGGTHPCGEEGAV